MVRPLTPEDIPAAMRLKDAAGWNQTEQDWRNLMRAAPGGVFGIDCGDTLAASASAICYGDRLAWIGMVLTHPEFRGRGFARRLMEHAIAWIEARGVDWIKLDGTDMGRPLYLKLGFEDECAIERWMRPALSAAPSNELRPAALDEFASLDAAAFGADRRALLEVLAPLGCSAVPGAGYAMARPGSNASYFGPCVATSAAAARELAGWCVARNEQRPVYWDILPENAAAAELAGSLGFAPVRRLMRMVRPGRPGARPLGHNDLSVFAIAGFEYG